MVVIEEADDGNESGGYSWGTPGEQHPQEQNDADSADRLLEQLEVLKAQANGRFKAGALQEALDLYKAALRQVGPPPHSSRLVGALQLNTGLMQLKMHEEAIKHCDLASSCEEHRAKALFRRAHAERELGRLAAASKSLEAAAEIEPKNAEIRRMLKQVRQTLKQEGSKTFSWGAEGDPQELARDAGNAPKADLAHRFARVSQWTEIESYYFVDDESTNFSLVKVVISLEHVHKIPPTDVSVKFEERSFELHVLDLGGVNWRMIATPLFGEIDPEKCQVMIKKDKVVLKMPKGIRALSRPWEKLRIS